MGTGKTTVSKILSEKMALPVLEMDEILEERFQMSINDIFGTLGEDAFRNEETELLREISDLDSPYIVSCGGGVPLKEENREILRSSGKVIQLSAAPETIWNRISNSKTRPLLSDGFDISKIAKMMAERKTSYEKATDITIDTSGKEPDEIASEIIEITKRR